MKFINLILKVIIITLVFNQYVKGNENSEDNQLNYDFSKLSNTQYLYKKNKNHSNQQKNYIVNHHYKYDDIEFNTNIIIDSLDKLEKVSTSTFSRGIVGVFSNNNNSHASYNYSKISDLFFNLSEYLNTKIEDLELEEVDID
ncbi:hypothetical protein [Spirobacillus cienkowskii]|uniref:hypothetical protein n=1 Tax=Spirobacillus cienkowskii TaxID=495820 RepID=UPI0030D4A2D5